MIRGFSPEVRRILEPHVTVYGGTTQKTTLNINTASLETIYAWYFGNDPNSNPDESIAEAIVAAHAGLRVLGLSTITNICSPDIPHVASGEAVVATAETARDKLRAIVTGIVEEEFATANRR